ncbi:hypothetical protein GCM10025767_26840 [Thalassotalea piscium]
MALAAEPMFRQSEVLTNTMRTEFNIIFNFSMNYLVHYPSFKSIVASENTQMK